ncbi:MAG: peroxiredoxin [Euzebya sp.]
MSDHSLKVEVGDRFPLDILPDLQRHVAAGDGMTAIYLYPADNTPTCTRQAIELDHAVPQFEAADIQVIGVSTDDEESHRCFAEDHALSFSLVADPDQKLVEELGAHKDYGKYGTLSDRVTFLLDSGGVVRRIWQVEDVVGHPREILEAAAEVRAAEAS